MKDKPEKIPEIQPILTGDGRLAYVNSTAHDDAIIGSILGSMNSNKPDSLVEELEKVWKEAVEKRRKEGIII